MIISEALDSSFMEKMKNPGFLIRKVIQTVKMSSGEFRSSSAIQRRHGEEIEELNRRKNRKF